MVLVLVAVSSPRAATRLRLFFGFGLGLSRRLGRVGFEIRQAGGALFEDAPALCGGALTKQVVNDAVVIQIEAISVSKASASSVDKRSARAASAAVMSPFWWATNARMVSILAALARRSPARRSHPPPTKSEVATAIVMMAIGRPMARPA